MGENEAGVTERLDWAIRRAAELEAENARLREEAAKLRRGVAELERDVAKLRGIVRARAQESRPTKLKDALRE